MYLQLHSRRQSARLSCEVIVTTKVFTQLPIALMILFLPTLRLNNLCFQAGAAALFTLAGAGGALASEFDLLAEKTPTSNYVIDDAGVLNRTSKKGLNDDLSKLEVQPSQSKFADCICFKIIVFQDQKESLLYRPASHFIETPINKCCDSVACLPGLDYLM